MSTHSLLVKGDFPLPTPSAEEEPDQSSEQEQSCHTTNHSSDDCAGVWGRQRACQDLTKTYDNTRRIGVRMIVNSLVELPPPDDVFAALDEMAETLARDEPAESVT
jgi:hypothetical protein